MPKDGGMSVHAHPPPVHPHDEAHKDIGAGGGVHLESGEQGEHGELWEAGKVSRSWIRENGGAM